MRVHVIFMPGTAGLLALPALSLHDASTCAHVWVANGLDAEEMESLQSIAGPNPRVEVLAVEAEHPLPHGTLLTLLAARETSPHFCFADADIFATGTCQPFLDAADTYPVQSTCDRLETMSVDRGASFLGGDGGPGPLSIPLTSSYFCTYRRDDLERAMAAYEIGFEQVWREEQVPTPMRDRLRQCGWTDHRYDTGKLLCVGLHWDGVAVRHQLQPSLIHVGGLGGPRLRQLDLADPFHLGGDLWSGRNCRLERSASRSGLRSPLQRHRKLIVSEYVWRLLSHVVYDSPQPTFAHDEIPLAPALRRIERCAYDVSQRHPELRG